VLRAVVFPREEVARDAALFAGAALALLGAVGPLLVALVAAGDAARPDLALGGFGVFVLEFGRRDHFAARRHLLEQVHGRAALEGLRRPGDRLLHDRLLRLDGLLGGACLERRRGDQAGARHETARPRWLAPARRRGPRLVQVRYLTRPGR